MYPSGDLSRDDSRSAMWLQRQAKFARQYVCSAARYDRQLSLTPNEPLQSFIDRAVTAGNNDLFDSFLGRDGGDACRVARSGSRDKVELNAESRQGRAILFNRNCSP